MWSSNSLEIRGPSLVLCRAQGGSLPSKRQRTRRGGGSAGRRTCRTRLAGS